MRSSHRLRLSSGLTAAIGLASLAVTNIARADESPPRNTVTVASGSFEPATETRWYGWQTLSVDLGIHLASFTAVQANGGYGVDQPVIAIASAAAYVAGAPIVHAAHGHWGRAGGSLAMRALGWAPCGLVGYGIGSATGAADGGTYGLMLGVMAGFVAPIVIDAAVLSNEKVVKKQPRDARVLPTAGALPNGGAIVGAAGTF